MSNRLLKWCGVTLAGACLYAAGAWSAVELYRTEFGRDVAHGYAVSRCWQGSKVDWDGSRVCSAAYMIAGEF